MSAPRKEVLAEGVEVWLGDARELLAYVHADALVSDPPYGIDLRPNYGSGARKYPNGKRYEPVKQYAAIAGDQVPFDPEYLLGFPEVLIWGANHYAPRLPEGGTWLVWDKRGPAIPPRSQADCEIAWLNKPEPARVFRHVWDGMVRDSERGVLREHPNQKPVALFEWCLKFINGSHIVDPYVGSGTTGIACIKAGRRFTGIEIDPGHFDTACKRIVKALAAPSFFIERPAPAKQEALL